MHEGEVGMKMSARDIISNNIKKFENQTKLIDDEDLKKLQRCELSILEDVNALAMKHGLHIMLGGGTLLGAVRHLGFIPWDDDIDLMMMRNEVETFISLVEEELSDRYEIQYAHQGTEHYMSFIKIRKRDTTYIELGYEHLPNTNGIYLDVFVIENIPDHPIKRNFYGLVCNFLAFLGPSLLFFNFESKFEKILYNSTCKGALVYNTRKFLGFLFSWKSVSDWYIILDQYFKKYEGNMDSKMVTVPSGRRHFFGEMLPRTYFQEFVLLPFESIEVYAPVCYKEYLLNLYGEHYLEIPPVSQREKHYVIDFDFEQRRNYAQ